MIDLNQPPNIVLKEILKLPLSEQEYWINKWQAQIPPDINTIIPEYKPLPMSYHWQDEPDSTTDILDRPRKGKFGRKERQEYAKTKAESEMKVFLNDQVKVEQASKKFKDHVNKGVEKLKAKLSEVK